MKKLVIGIAVVALLALMAVPAMAALDTETVDVTITVLTYGAITFNPDATMSFNVAGPYEGVDPPPAYGDTKDFRVLCNVASTLTVEADTTSDSAEFVVPGQLGDAGNPYPTAIGFGTALGHNIGFGLAVKNLDTNTYVPWGTDSDFTKVVVNFAASSTSDLDPNGRITVNTYMDSSRDGDALAPPGPYLSTLTLTLSVA